MVAVNNFAAHGMWLFVDQILIAIAGWAFWLVIFGFTTADEIGRATTIYSLVFVISTIVQLGLEYPLLKRTSSIDDCRVFGTALVIEMLILVVSIPVIVYSIGNLLELGEFTWISIGILIASTIGSISRFALLGLSDIRSVLVIDVIGTVTKFIFGFFLVTMGYAAFGILLALFIQALVIMCGTLIICIRNLGLKLGDISYGREIIKHGLVNSLSKFSRMLVVSFVVLLLASFGVDDSDIGIFYVASMISLAAISLSSSIAYMVIPASNAARSDFSAHSLRISLSLVSPLIVLLIVAPRFILSVFGDLYVYGQDLLLILSIGILPAAVTINTISRLNNLNMYTKLIYLGLIQITILIVTFYLFVPNYGTLGAGISIVISFIISAIVSIMWLDRTSSTFVAHTTLAISIATLVAYCTHTLLGPEYYFLGVLLAIVTDIAIILTLKTITKTEIREIFMSMVKSH